MPQAATKRDAHVPVRLILATFLLTAVALAAFLPRSTQAQSPNETDTAPSPIGVEPQERRLPNATPNDLPNTGSGGLFPSSDPLAHPDGLSLTAALVGAGLVAALAGVTVIASHRARRETPVIARREPPVT